MRTTVDVITKGLATGLDPELFTMREVRVCANVLVCSSTSGQMVCEACMTFDGRSIDKHRTLVCGHMSQARASRHKILKYLIHSAPESRIM